MICALHALIMQAVFDGLLAPVAAPETIGTHIKNKENKKIRILADKLIAGIDAGEMEFIGNVKASQAETVITADRLKIRYDPETIHNQKRTAKPGSIQEIIASGHVKIIYGNIIAETEKAEYRIQSAILVLAGDQSRITQGNRTISGSKFTLHRSNGKITVESGPKARVKAVFGSSPKDK